MDETLHTVSEGLTPLQRSRQCLQLALGLRSDSPGPASRADAVSWPFAGVRPCGRCSGRVMLRFLALPSAVLVQWDVEFRCIRVGE